MNCSFRSFASFRRTDLNETEPSQPLVIYNNDNATAVSRNQTVDKNQFAETVVDLLLDLLEKANLSRTVSVIHNDTELTELVEQDDGDHPNVETTTMKLPAS